MDMFETDQNMPAEPAKAAFDIHLTGIRQEAITTV